MNPWPFVAAAYGVTLGGASVLTWLSWRSARAAETRAERAGERARR